ncbi:ferritin [bacterium]|nr:ferritin [bacterium]
MLSKKMSKAMNHQVNRELYSAYLYLSMAAYFRSINLNGFANWMEIQCQEEMTHAQKFYQFIDERGEKVVLEAIEAPPHTWKTPLQVFEETFKHEQHVTSLINNLVKLAQTENDYASHSFLQWFVNEQVEEESTADDIVQQLKLVGNQGQGLFMLDRELGQRVFTMPSQSD